MNPAELGKLRTELKGQLDSVTGGELPLMTLEPKGEGLFTCPREHIYEVVKSLGEEVSRKTIRSRPSRPTRSSSRTAAAQSR